MSRELQQLTASNSSARCAEYRRDSLGILDFVAGNSLCLADAAEEVAPCKCLGSRRLQDLLGCRRRRQRLRNHLSKRVLRRRPSLRRKRSLPSPEGIRQSQNMGSMVLERRLHPERHTDDRYPTSSRQPPFDIPLRAWWPLLRENLEALMYDLVQHKTRLIKKEDLLVRLGRSPDRGDALIQSFAFD